MLNGHLLESIYYYHLYYIQNSYLASCSFDNKILIWSKINFEWETISTLDGHENEVKCISWNNTEEYIASCGRDKRIFIYGKSIDNEFDCITILDGHTQDIKFIKWHNNVLYSCSYDNSIRMWNEFDDNWICNQIIIGHKTTVWEIDFNDDNIMYSCDGNGVIGIWELNSKNRWENVKFLSNLHSMTVYSINYNKNLNILVTGCRDNIIRYFEYDDEEKEFNLIDDFQSHESDINCVRFNPVKSNILCSCSDDEKVKIWKISEILD